MTAVWRTLSLQTPFWISRSLWSRSICDRRRSFKFWWVPRHRRSVRFQDIVEKPRQRSGSGRPALRRFAEPNRLALHRRSRHERRDVKDALLQLRHGQLDTGTRPRNAEILLLLCQGEFQEPVQRSNRNGRCSCRRSELNLCVPLLNWDPLPQ